MEFNKNLYIHISSFHTLNVHKIKSKFLRLSESCENINVMENWICGCAKITSIIAGENASQLPETLTAHFINSLFVTISKFNHGYRQVEIPYFKLNIINTQSIF